jgi:hypothetical protein
MERCVLSKNPPLKVIGLTSKNVKKSAGLVKQAEVGISNVKIPMSNRKPRAESGTNPRSLANTPRNIEP